MTSPSTEDYLAENVSGNLERVPEAPEETSVTEATPNIQKPRDMKSYTFGLIVIAVLSSIFLFSLDNTVVADVQPAIVGSLGDIEKLPWISVSFALGAVSVNLIWYVNRSIFWCVIQKLKVIGDDSLASSTLKSCSFVLFFFSKLGRQSVAAPQLWMPLSLEELSAD